MSKEEGKSSKEDESKDAAEPQRDEAEIKLILLGDSAVGKTSPSFTFPLTKREMQPSQNPWPHARSSRRKRPGP